MVLRKLMGLFACALLLGIAATASAGVPDLANTTANTAYHAGGGTLTLSLFSLPNAAGNPFTVCFLPGAATADGTITLTLMDDGPSPIANYPAEDMWIASEFGGMVPCSSTSGADFNTNEFGVTQWVNPLFAGGSDTGDCIVYVNGDELTAHIAMQFNSADINGDGFVNLPDTGFMTDYIGTTTYAGDFNFSGAVNLPDTGFMTAGLGANCP